MKKFEQLGRSLSKDEQKKVSGGVIDGNYPGGCCVHTGSWNGYQCGLSRKQVDLVFDGGDGGWDNWCCSSCQSSWTQA